MESLPKLYTELADWWPVLSIPEDYEEEALFYRQTINSAVAHAPRTLLELGSGGGNNASHLKKSFSMTLVDLSPAMLAVSQGLNSECEHIQGDMRTVRLNRQFDAVFVHDAIDYMQSVEDLRCAMNTAYEHCKPGGVVLFAPDHTLENFKPTTTHGGHDCGNRCLRYLEWNWDPDPSDHNCISMMVYIMREANKPVRCVEDQHEFGLFSRREWLRFMQDTGFAPSAVPFEHSEIEAGASECFLGLKPDADN